MLCYVKCITNVHIHDVVADTGFCQIPKTGFQVGAGFKGDHCHMTLPHR